ncbi:MAG: putative lipid II flippase FtsW [bacterium]
MSINKKSLIASQAKEILVIIAYFLSVFGLIMILDISSVNFAAKGGNPYLIFLKQMLWLFIASVIFFILLEIEIKTIRRIIPVVMPVSILLLVILLIPAITPAVKGARRWIILTKSVMVQPVEFVKIIWILYLADYLDRHRKELDDFKILVGPMIILAVLTLLVFSQPDFGSTVTLILLFLVVFFLAHVPISRLIVLVLAGIPLIYWAIFGSPYRKDRITAFLAPFKHGSDEGYQLTRSLIAIASGGIFGKGAGSSTSRLMYLPCAHTDFIFSVICEEFGFIGSLFVLFLFSVFVIIGFKMAVKCRDNFSRIAIGSLTSLIAISALANIAVSIGLLPTKGMALPFMSYGGSNLLATFIAIGLIITIYMESAERMLG